MKLFTILSYLTFIVKKCMQQNPPPTCNSPYTFKTTPITRIEVNHKLPSTNPAGGYHVKLGYSDEDPNLTHKSSITLAGAWIKITDTMVLSHTLPVSSFVQNIESLGLERISLSEIQNQCVPGSTGLSATPTGIDNSPESFTRPRGQGWVYYLFASKVEVERDSASPFNVIGYTKSNEIFRTRF